MRAIRSGPLANPSAVTQEALARNISDYGNYFPFQEATDLNCPSKSNSNDRFPGWQLACARIRVALKVGELCTMPFKGFSGSACVLVGFGPTCALAQVLPDDRQMLSAPISNPTHEAGHANAKELASREEAPSVGDANPKVETKTKPQIATQSSSEDKADESYIIGIADELKISVWKEPDLSGPVVVRPDGMITLPVIDDVYVLGLTTSPVQDLLTEKLKSVVEQPEVTVIVQNIRSRKVYLVGQVGHPGAVSLTAHETVLQILAESGGPIPLPKLTKFTSSAKMAINSRSSLSITRRRSREATQRQTCAGKWRCNCCAVAC